LEELMRSQGVALEDVEGVEEEYLERKRIFVI
jgi:hypothetical protein